MSKLTTIISISAIALALMLYWALVEQENSGSISGPTAGTTESITVGYSRLRISLPVFVAQERGFFEKHGLEVSLEMYDTAQPLMQALVEGRLVAAGYTALPITFNGMIRSGKKLYFLTTMVEDGEHRISYLLKPNGSPISAVGELKGKTIGILPTVAYKGWLEAILTANGLDPEVDVRIQQVAPTQQPQALNAGAVDALFTNDPAATTAIQLGIAELVNPNTVEAAEYIRDPFPFGSFNVDKAWADTNPEVFAKLRQALDEAVRFINSNPDEAKQSMIPYLPDVFAKHVAAYPRSRYLPSSETTQSDFEEVSDFYLEAGIVPEKPDLQDLIVND